MSLLVKLTRGKLMAKKAYKISLNRAFIQTVSVNLLRKDVFFRSAKQILRQQRHRKPEQLKILRFQLEDYAVNSLLKRVLDFTRKSLFLNETCLSILSSLFLFKCYRRRRFFLSNRLHQAQFLQHNFCTHLSSPKS